MKGQQWQVFILPMSKSWANPIYGSAICHKAGTVFCSGKDSRS